MMLIYCILRELGGIVTTPISSLYNYCIMRAGEGDDANARMDKLKPKAAQFQSFILIYSFLHAAVQCSNDQSLMNLALGHVLLLDEYPRLPLYLVVGFQNMLCNGRHLRLTHPSVAFMLLSAFFGCRARLPDVNLMTVGAPQRVHHTRLGVR